LYPRLQWGIDEQAGECSICYNMSHPVRRTLRTAATSTVAALTLLIADLRAEEAERVDKGGFSFFHPTPVALMREMSLDRPDKTESPFTVDAGHIQVEMDMARYTHDETDGVTTTTWNVAPVNFKVGLLNYADLQFVFDDYLHIRRDEPGTSAITQAGVGDLATRLKVNLWGNDGGRTAFAVMPFVKWPTSTDGLGNNSVEGGIILPLAVEGLPAGFSVGAMTEVDVLRDETGDGYHPSFVNTITLNHDLVGPLGVYVEFYSEVSSEQDSAWVGTVDFGLTYGLSKNIQLDAGVNIGVTRSADDVDVFSGVSFRF
jgi:hypothetical protein